MLWWEYDIEGELDTDELMWAHLCMDAAKVSYSVFCITFERYMVVGGGVWLCSMLCIKPAHLKTILFQLQGVNGW